MYVDKGLWRVLRAFDWIVQEVDGLDTSACEATPVEAAVLMLIKLFYV